MFDLKSVSVLIVDDEFDIRKILYDFFLLNGFTEVRTVENGKKAIELVAQELQSGRHFDVIITDVVMPEMNGFDFVDGVYEISPQSLIFMMTGTHLDDIKARYFSGRIQGFFKKPVSGMFIIKIVSTILEMVRQK